MFILLLIASAWAVCDLHVHLAPELTESITDYWYPYARQAVSSVNAIFGARVPNLRLANISRINIGVYVYPETLLAHFAAIVPSDPVCIRVLFAARNFDSAVGIAYVGSACRPGIAAVFNVDQRLPVVHFSGKSEIDQSAWARRDSAAVVLGHECLHTMNVSHTENPADIMYYRAQVSELPQKLDLNVTAALPCVSEKGRIDMRIAQPAIFSIGLLIIMFILQKKFFAVLIKP